MMPHLAGILTPSPISCTHHLIIDDDIDAVGLVPAFTQSIVYHWHIHSLQSLRAKSGAWRQMTKCDLCTVLHWCPIGMGFIGART